MGLLDAPAVRPQARGWRGTGLVPLACRYGRFDLTASNGTDTETNCKLAHTAVDTAANPQLLYHNPGSSPVTICASIEYPSTFPSRVFFDGEVYVTIQPGAWRLSDPHPIVFNKGNVFWTRTHTTVSPGQTWQYTVICSESGELEETGVSLGDKTLSGTIGSGAAGAFGPMAVLYDPGKRVPVVAGVGDSIMVAKTTAGSSGNAFMRIACEGTVSLYLVGMSSETMQTFSGQNVLQRHRAVGLANWYICQYGHNDYAVAARTMAQLQADWLTGWTMLARTGRVLQTTMTPYSTSTDNWATVGNQTAHATNTTRNSINDWLLDGAPIDPITLAAVATGTVNALRAGQGAHPLAAPSQYPKGVVDVNTAVESAPHSGLWLGTTGGQTVTTDGVHPSQKGHQLIATVINTAAFT